jgi:hypothetical protein
LQLLGHAGLENGAEALEDFVEGGDGFSGELSGFVEFDTGLVGVFEPAGLIGGEFVEAVAEGLVFAFAEVGFGEGFVGEEIKEVVSEDEAVAGFVAGVTKGFKAGDGADPGHEVGVGLELAEFAPGDEGGFLKDIVDIFPGGEKGAEEATESGFVSHEEANEGFVGFRGGRGGHKGILPMEGGFGQVVF